MAIEVLAVTPGSPAAKAGVRPGDSLLRINGEDVLDEIDYQALTVHGRLTLELKDAAGQCRSCTLRKDPWAPLGLTLDERIVLSPRSCANHCVFCFVDQLPPGMRKSLYVRDDDWRLSLMMGNFITLTNVSDREFDRILRRKASPLYISVHATDPDVRVRLLRNPTAGNLMARLRLLKEHGLRFHAQVVLCPGLNDGAVLHQTIVDLAGLYPACQSLAIVPVGLTGHREGLDQLRPFDRDGARSLLRDLELIQAWYLKNLGTRFLFPSDELYSIAGLPVPPDEAYEDYVQLENGVGMVRRLAQECEDFYPEVRSAAGGAGLKRRVLLPTGVSALPYIQDLVARYGPKETDFQVLPVENRFFGKSVTVTGLIVGQDLLRALDGLTGDQVLISATMLREGTDCFLDDLTVREVQSRLGIPVRAVDNNGESFLKALYGLEE